MTELMFFDLFNTARILAFDSYVIERIIRDIECFIKIKEVVSKYNIVEN